MINFLLEAWETYMLPYMLPEFCIFTDVGFVPVSQPALLSSPKQHWTTVLCLGCPTSISGYSLSNPNYFYIPLMPWTVSD